MALCFIRTNNRRGSSLVNLGSDLQLVEFVGQLHDGLVLHLHQLKVGGDILVLSADLLLQQLFLLLLFAELSFELHNGFILVPVWNENNLVALTSHPNCSHRRISSS